MISCNAHFLNSPRLRCRCEISGVIEHLACQHQCWPGNVHLHRCALNWTARADCRTSASQSGTAPGSEVSVAQFMNSTYLHCDLSHALIAGDNFVQISLNGQQFHDSSVRFHFAPVVYFIGDNAIGRAPFGSDRAGTNAYVTAYGITGTFSPASIRCKFTTSRAAVVTATSVDANGVVHCVVPELASSKSFSPKYRTYLTNAGTVGLQNAVVQVSVDAGVHYSAVGVETDPCTCHGRRYALNVTTRKCQLTGAGTALTRCWVTASNTFMYHQPVLLEDLGLTETHGAATFSFLWGAPLNTTRSLRITGFDNVGEIVAPPAGYASGDIKCRFKPLGTVGATIGTIYVNATIDNTNAGSLTVRCDAPWSPIPRDVAVEVTLNGQQYSHSPRPNWAGPLALSSVSGTFAVAGESGLLYNYYDNILPPSIRTISPASGAKTGGTLIRVMGANFANKRALACRFVRPLNETCPSLDMSTPPRYGYVGTSYQWIPGPSCASCGSGVDQTGAPCRVNSAGTQCINGGGCKPGDVASQTGCTPSGGTFGDGSGCSFNPGGQDIGLELSTTAAAADNTPPAGAVGQHIPEPALDVVLTSGARFISTGEVECRAPAVGALGNVETVFVQVSNDCELTRPNSNAPWTCSTASWSSANVAFRYTATSPLYSTAEGQGLGMAGTPFVAGAMQTFEVKAFEAPEPTGPLTGDCAGGRASARCLLTHSGGDIFSATLTTTDEQLVPPVVFTSTTVDWGDGRHQIAYNVTLAGVYQLRVLLGGLSVQSGVTPYTMTNPPAGYAAQVSNLRYDAAAAGVATPTGWNPVVWSGWTAANTWPQFDPSLVPQPDLYYPVIIKHSVHAGHKAEAGGGNWNTWRMWGMPVWGNFTVQAKDRYGNTVTNGGGVLNRIALNLVGEPLRCTQSARCHNLAQPTVGTRWADNSDGTYTVQFTATKAGNFSVTVEMDNEQIASSGHVLHVLPDQSEFGPSSFTVNGTRIAGQPLNIDIQGADQYHNIAELGGNTFRITFIVVGYTQSTPFKRPVTETRQMVPADNQDGTYTLLHTPTLSGDYTIKIQLCAGERGRIPNWQEFDNLGLPYQQSGCRQIGNPQGVGDGRGYANATIDAANPFGPNTLAYGTAIDAGQSGYSFTFTIEARDRYNNRVQQGQAFGVGVLTGSLFHNVHNRDTPFIANTLRSSWGSRDNPRGHCTNSETGECAVRHDVGDGTYYMSYRVTLSGNYKITLAIDGQSISTRGHTQGINDVGTTWFILDIDADAANPSQSIITGNYQCVPNPNCITSSTAGQIQHLAINAIDRFGNERTRGGDQMRLKFKPFSPNKFGQIVSWPGAPGGLTTNANNLVYSTDCKNQHGMPGNAMSECVDGRSFNASQVLIDPGNGDYSMTYNLTKTGNYLLYIYINHQIVLAYSNGVAAIPLNVLPAAPFPGTSKASGTMIPVNGSIATPVRAGYVASFLITSYDRYENLVPYGGRNMSADFQPLDAFLNPVVNFGPTEIDGGGTFAQRHDFTGGTGYVNPFDVQDPQNGLYSMNFTFYSAGPFRIYVSMDGAAIYASPHLSNCVPGPIVIQNSVLEPTTAQPNALQTSIAGTTYTATLWSRDVYGNRLLSGGNNFTAIATFDASTANAIVSPASVSEFARDTSLALQPNLTQTHLRSDLQVVDNNPAGIVPDPTIQPFSRHNTAGSYAVTYRLTIAGRYNISADLGGVAIRNSPVSLLIKPADLSLSTSYAYGEGTKQTWSGEPANFTVVATDAYTNRLSTGGAFLRGTILGPRYVPVLVPVDLTDGQYRFDYNLDLIGVHSIQVKAGLQQFAFSPIFPVSVMPGDTQALNCAAQGAGLSVADIGYYATFVVQARDRYNNPKYDPLLDHFTASIYHAVSNITDSSNATITGNAATGLYYGRYRRFRPAGAWTLSILLSTNDRLTGGTTGPPRHIANSPFAVNMRAAPVDAGHCTAVGNGVRSFVAGQTARLTVTSRDEFDNHVEYSTATAVLYTVAITGPGSPSVSMLVSNRDGTYDQTWSSTTSGNFTVSVTLTGTASASPHIVGSPFAVVVYPDVTDMARSVFEGAALTNATAGTLEVFTLHTRDRYGNQRSTGLSSPLTAAVLVTADGGASISTLQTTVTDLQNGTLTASYNVTQAGTHALHVALGQTQRKRYTLVVVPSAVHNPTTMAEGWGLAGTFAGSTAMFDIVPKDRYGNPVLAATTAISATFSVDSSVIAWQTTPATGSAAHPYRWSYLPASAPSALGSHRLTVTYGGANISGSPYNVTILSSDQTLEASCSLPGTVSEFPDPGASRTQFEAGVAAALGVPASGVNIKSVTAGRRRRLNEDEQNQVWEGRRILQTTVSITYTVVSAQDLTAAFGAANFAATLVSSINSAGSSMATLTTSSLTLVPPTIVSSYPTAPGSCYAFGTSLARAMSGVRQSFTVQLVNNMNVAQQVTANERVVGTLRDANGTSVGSATISSNNDGTLTGLYTLSLKGMYTMTVTVNEVPVSNSPFSIRVTSGFANANSTYLTTPTSGRGAPNITAVAGQATDASVFPIDVAGNREDYGRDLNASRIVVIYTNGRRQVLPVSSTALAGESLYTSTISETVAGHYNLSVSLYGSPILMSPFSLIVVPAAAALSKFQILGSAASGSLAGVDALFHIIARDAYDNAVPSATSGLNLTFALTDMSPAVTYPPAREPNCEDYGNRSCCAAAMAAKKREHLNQACFGLVNRLVYGLQCAPADVAWRNGSRIILCNSFCNQLRVCSASLHTFDAHVMCAGYNSGPACSSSADCGGGSCDFGTCFSSGMPTCFAGTDAQIGLSTLPQNTMALSLMPNISTGLFDVRYRDNRTGVMSVTFTYVGVGVIPGTPLQLAITPAAVDTDLFYLQGPGLSVAEVGKVAGTRLTGPYDERAEFVVRARDTFSNFIDSPLAVSVTVYLDGPRLINVAVTPNNDGTYTAKYAAVVSGTYTITLQFGTTVVRRSVWMIAGPTAPAQTTHDLAALQRSSVAGAARTFYISTRDAFGNLRGVGGDSMNMTVPNIGTGALASSDLVDGRYRVSYIFTVAGVYNIHVGVGMYTTMFGQEYPCPAVPQGTLCSRPSFSPLSITVQPDVTVTGTISGLTSAIAGVETSFTIRGIDRYGNDARYDPFLMGLGFGADFYTAGPHAVLFTPNASYAIGAASTRIVNNLDNTFTVFYTLTVAATHLVTVEYPLGSGALTADSPKQFVVAPAAPYGVESLLAPTPSNFIVGDVNFVDLQVCDSLRNNLSVGGATVSFAMRLFNISGAALNSFPVADTGNGRYSANYTVTISGQYQVYATVNSVALAASPWSVQVAPGAMDPLKATATGFGLTGGYVTPDNRPHTFMIHARDSYGNPVDADPSNKFSVSVWANAANGWGRVRKGNIETRINSIGAVEVPVTHRGCSDCVRTGACLCSHKHGATAATPPNGGALLPPFSDDTTVAATVEYIIYEPGQYEVQIKYCANFSDTLIPGFTTCSVAHEIEISGSIEVVATTRTHTARLIATFVHSNVTYPASNVTSFATGAGLAGTTAGVEAMIAIELRNRFNVPQPVGVDLGDDVNCVLQGPSTHVARTQGICCDDDARVAQLTNNAYENCSVAKSFLENAGLSCNTDLGTSSPFRFLKTLCPGECGVCVPNCASRVLVFYNPTVSGAYSVTIRINGGAMGSVQQMTVAPAQIHAPSCYITVRNAIAEAGQLVESRLYLRDRYQNARLYTAEDVTIEAIANTLAGMLTDVEETNMMDGSCKLTFTPTAATSYGLSVKFNGVVAVNAPSITPCGSLASRQFVPICVAAGTPALVPTTFNIFGGVTSVTAGPFTIIINPVDLFGNVHTVAPSCPTPDCFKCIAYDMLDPQGPRFADVIAQYNFREGNGKYVASMVLTQARQYGVLCFLGNSALSNNPIALNVLPGRINSSNTLVSGQGLTLAVAGVQQSILVTPRDTYGNIVQTGNIVLTGAMQGPVNVALSFAQQPSGLILGTYLAITAGNYTVAIVRGGGSPISSSPWTSLIVQPGIINPARCSIVNQPSTAIAGTNWTFSMVSRDFYGNQLAGGDFILTEASRMGSFERLSGVSSDNGDGSYRFRYNIQLVYVFQIRVFISGVNIAGTPFNVSITPGPVDQSQSPLAGSGIFYAVVGSPNLVAVTAKDAYGNPTNNLGSMTPSIDIKLGAVLLKAMYAADAKVVGTFAVNYTVTRATLGVQLSVTWGTIHFQGSPFLIDVHPGMAVAAQTTLVHASAAPVGTNKKEVPAGTIAEFVITPKDTHGNIITNLTSASTFSWFSVHSQPQIADLFQVTCNLLTTVGPLMVPRNCTTLFVRDSGDNYTVVVSDPLASPMPDWSTPSDQTRTPYFLTVSIGGVPVTNSPMPFIVVPGTRVDAAQSTAEGQGLVGGFRGTAASFKVVPRDQYGNRLTRSSAADQQQLVVTTTPTIAGAGAISRQGSSDTYRYTPDQPTSGTRTYGIRVTYFGTDVQGSPFSPLILASASSQGPAGNKSVALQLPGTQGLHGVVAGMSGEFTVQARDANGVDRLIGGEVPVVTVSNVAAGLPVFVPTVAWTSGSHGQYKVTYRTTLAGQYMVGVAINGAAITGSPLALTIVASDVVVSNSNFSGVNCTAGVLCTRTLRPVDQYGNLRTYRPDLGPDVVSMSVQPEFGQAIAGTVVDQRNGITILTFTATAAMSYSITVMWRVPPPTPAPPHQVWVLPGALHTGSCVATGAGVTATVAGETATFVIVSKDRHGNLIHEGGQQFLTGKVGGAMTPATDNSDGTYTATYTVTTSGTQRVVGIRAGYDISGSPFLVTVAPNVVHPGRCTVDATDLGQITPLVPATFTASLFDQYGNARDSLDSVTASATVKPTAGGSGETTVATVVHTGGGVYEITYEITTFIVFEAGQTEVTVKVGGTTIGASPYEPYLLLLNPPVATSSKFTALARSIEVIFDQATDLAGTVTMMPCTHYFTAASSAMLGAGNQCIWQSESLLLVVLGTDAPVQVGTTLLLVPDRIRNKRQNSRATSGGFGVLAPSNPVQPSVVLSAADSYASCDIVVLDASATSGGAGRALRYNWGLNPNVPNFDSLAAWVRSNSGSILTLPAGNLSAGVSYTFHLRATNFFNEFKSAQTTFVVSSLPLPQVSIGDGATQVHTTKDQPLFLTAKVVLSSCMPREFAKMGFVWRVVGSSMDLESGFTLARPAFAVDARTRYTRTLMIHKDTLIPGEWYDLNITARSVRNASYHGSATVRVVVDYTPVTAVIAGGDRQVSRLATIVLDGSKSIDPDDMPVAFANAWSCYKTTDENLVPLPDNAYSPSGRTQCFSDTTGLLVASSQVLQLPSGLLTAGLHTFGLSVAKEKGSGITVSSAVVVLNVTAAAVPTVTIDAGSLNLLKINPSAKIVLHSVVEEVSQQVAIGGKHEVSWECVGGGFNMTNPVLRGSDVDNPAFILKPQALGPGQTYRFSLKSQSLAQDGGIGEASVELAVNLKPSGGRFVSTPSNGTYRTKFELRAFGWVDEDMPLTYQFRRLQPARVFPGEQPDPGAPPEEIPVGSLAPSQQNVIQTNLPEGEPHLNYSIVIAARVYDAFQAYAEARVSILVYPESQQDESAFIQNGEEMLERSFDEGALADALTITDIMAKKMQPPQQEDTSARRSHRRLQSAQLIAVRSKMLSTVVSAFGASPVTPSSCASFANSVKGVVGAPLEMTLPITGDAASFSAVQLLGNCTSLGFGHGDSTHISLIDTYSSLLDARDFSGSAERQQQVYLITNQINAAVNTVSDTLLGAKEINEERTLIASANIVLISEKLDTPRIVGKTLTIPAVGGHIGQEVASFTLPNETLAAVPNAAVNMVLKWWGKDPAVISQQRGALLSSVLELELIALPSDVPNVTAMAVPAAGGRRRLHSATRRPWADTNASDGLTAPAGSDGPSSRRQLTAAAPIPVQLAAGTCINISIPMTATAYALSPSYVATCVTWDNVAQDWTKDGCYVRRAFAEQAQCCCSHLSSFGVLLENSQPSMDLTPYLFDDVIDTVLSGSRPEPLFAVTGVLLLYFVALAWGHRRDQMFKAAHREAALQIEETKNLFTAYKKHLEKKTGGAAVQGSALDRKKASSSSSSSRPHTPSDIIITTPEKLAVRSSPAKPTGMPNRPRIHAAGVGGSGSPSLAERVASVPPAPRSPSLRPPGAAAKRGLGLKTLGRSQGTQVVQIPPTRPSGPQAPAAATAVVPLPPRDAKDPKRPPRPDARRQLSGAAASAAAQPPSVPAPPKSGAGTESGGGPTRPSRRQLSPAPVPPPPEEEEAHDDGAGAGLGLSERVRGGGGAADGSDDEPLVPTAGEARQLPAVPQPSSATLANPHEQANPPFGLPTRPQALPPGATSDELHTSIHAVPDDLLFAAQQTPKHGGSSVGGGKGGGGGGAMPGAIPGSGGSPSSRPLPLPSKAAAAAAAGHKAPRSIVDVIAPPGQPSRPQPPRRDVKTPRRLRGKGLRRVSTPTTGGSARKVRLRGASHNTVVLDTPQFDPLKRFAEKPEPAADGAERSPSRLSYGSSSPGSERESLDGASRAPSPDKGGLVVTPEVKLQQIRPPCRCPGQACAGGLGLALRKYHLVVSIVVPGTMGIFTRPQRATVAVSTLFLEMAGPALATRYLSPGGESGGGDGLGVQDMLYVGGASALLAAPLAYALAKLFVVTGEKYRETRTFLTHYALEKERWRTGAGGASAQANLAEMIAQDEVLHSIKWTTRCCRWWGRLHIGASVRRCGGATRRCVCTKLLGRHPAPQTVDAPPAAGPAGPRRPGTADTDRSDELEHVKKVQAQERKKFLESEGELGETSLPPEATLRYFQWRWLHHAIYCCCFVISICAIFHVIFLGMKFDVRGVQAWAIGVGAAFAADLLVLQPLVACARRWSDKRRARLATGRKLRGKTKNLLTWKPTEAAAEGKWKPGQQTGKSLQSLTTTGQASPL
jgi:hypothetical protein